MVLFYSSQKNARDAQAGTTVLLYKLCTSEAVDRLWKELWEKKRKY